MKKAPRPTGIEAAVCADIASRQRLGIAKYGKTVAGNPLTLREWLWHAYEETLDKAVYLRRAVDEIDRSRGKHIDRALSELRVIEAWASLGKPPFKHVSKWARNAIEALSATSTLPGNQNAVAGKGEAKAHASERGKWWPKWSEVPCPSPRLGTLPKSGTKAGAKAGRRSGERKKGPKC
jgi:hypothetical protein